MSIIHFNENLTKQIPDEIEERDGSASGAAETIVALTVHVRAGGVNLGAAPQLALVLPAINPLGAA